MTTCTGTPTDEQLRSLIQALMESPFYLSMPLRERLRLVKQAIEIHHLSNPR